MNITLDEVSQFAHVGWGYILVTFPCLIFHSPLYIPVLVVVAGAGIKEYWDCHGLETTGDSGGVSGSWEDFGFWCVGIALAALVIR